MMQKNSVSNRSSSPAKRRHTASVTGSGPSMETSALNAGYVCARTASRVRRMKSADRYAGMQIVTSTGAATMVNFGVLAPVTRIGDDRTCRKGRGTRDESGAGTELRASADADA